MLYSLSRTQSCLCVGQNEVTLILLPTSTDHDPCLETKSTNKRTARDRWDDQTCTKPSLMHCRFQNREKPIRMCAYLTKEWIQSSFRRFPLHCTGQQVLLSRKTVQCKFGTGHFFLCSASYLLSSSSQAYASFRFLHNSSHWLKVRYANFRFRTGRSLPYALVYLWITFCLRFSNTDFTCLQPWQRSLLSKVCETWPFLGSFS